MRGFKKALTKKLGPLPRWAWGVLAIGGVFAYRARQAAGFGQQQANDSGYKSPQTPPDLAYEPGGALPISPDTPSPSSDDVSGLLSLIGEILKQRNNGGKRAGNGKKHPGKHPPTGHPKHTKHKKKTERWPAGKVKHGDRPKGKGTGQGVKGYHPAKPRQDTPQGQKHRHRKRPVVGWTGDMRQQTARPPASHTPQQREHPKPPARPSAPPRRTVRQITPKHPAVRTVKRGR